CQLDISKSAEQLEFLGDSVLGLVISEFLFKTYSKSNEGDYSKARNTLVNEKKLANFARMLRFDQLVFLGRGELGKKGYERDSLLADTFEAFLAAVYLNYGFEISYRFIKNILKVTKMDQIDFEEARISDAKSTLQEYFLSKYKTFPEYSAEKLMEAGEERFSCQLKLKGKILKQGVFASKKKGHKKLAQEYLIEINQKNEIII
ncbi:putative dsRNA-binding protein, partial [Bacteriovoracaceae bacterium]|nr:putative dsRNA-binding protein [Bacteriovoracaceae bacterium]